MENRRIVIPMHLIAEEGPLRGMIINFEEGTEWIIGRDPNVSDFVLEDTTVSRKHLLCTREADGITIKDLSTTNPILVNDHTIGESYLLQEGDKIQIGQNVFLFFEEEPPFLEETLPEKEEKPEEIVPKITKEKQQKSETPIEPQIPKLPSEEIPFEPTYDTIYEEQELPFHMLSESPFLLKVVSGPNVGAEYGMDKGKSYLIGKDPHIVDIVFNDLSVSKQHAQIEIDEEGTVAISDRDSKNGTFINGKKILQRTVITSKDIISLGTSSFLVIDQKAPSETIYSPVPSYEILSSEEKVVEKEAISWKKQIIPTKYLITAGVFVSLLFVVFISFFSLFRSEKVVVVKRDKPQEIENVIAKYNGITFSFNPAGDTLFLTGHVLSSVDHQELLYDIQQLRFVQKTEDTVIIDELVWKNTNAILSDNPIWRGISLHGSDPGKFILTGYLKTPQEKEDLMDYMNQHFPYLDKLENKIVVENLLLEEIGASLIKNGFGGIQYGLIDGELILSGFYDEKKGSDFKILKEKLDRLYGIRQIKDLSVASSELTARIDLTQKYRVTGSATYDNKGFGIIINGQILTVGDLLEQMMITDISPNTVYLEKEGAKYKITYSP
ncbi:MAG: type III secretion system inner membrane ring subunit SctD [Parachlamydiales bacterium]|nr:type III secretion system inner membrane ring subunit SctD [Parachlamydiales bacterium]